MEECSPPPSPSPPPWEVVNLVAHYMDPITLASASCVCKSWSICISSDHLWHPICSADFPSLSTLHPSIPYRKLYSLGRAAANRLRRKPPGPRLSLRNLSFSFDVRRDGARGPVVFALARRGRQLDGRGVFRFDFAVEDPAARFEEAEEAAGGLRVTWNVVLEDSEAVFTALGGGGKGKAGRIDLGRRRLEGWFSEELPPPPDCCLCSGGDSSGIVAEARLGLRRDDGGVAVEEVSLGILSVGRWRYVSVDEALAYLQHFLSG